MVSIGASAGEPDATGIASKPAKAGAAKMFGMARRIVH
jgi:hypothetical protein